MRAHNLRASLAGTSGGSSSNSFSRGMWGGGSYTIARPQQYDGSWQGNSYYFYAGTNLSTSTSPSEELTWNMPVANQQTFFCSYYRANKVKSIIDAAELTDQNVPSGAKFNKFSSYIWGKVAPTGKIPRGLRLRLYHVDTQVSGTTRYPPKTGETPTIVYQDTGTTEFPPLKSLADDVVALSAANNNQTYTTTSNMRLAGYTIMNGTATSNSDGNGSGELIEINFGGGNDTSVTKASEFTWNGSDNICVEIATKQTASSYESNTGVSFSKHKDSSLGWDDRFSRSDSSASHYDANTNSGYTRNRRIMKLTAGTPTIARWIDIDEYENAYSNDHSANVSNSTLSLKLNYTT
tara:strand:- start:603 stop:1652 length:1050 start_codon:yes stop_codon:yes gene_type:complete